MKDVFLVLLLSLTAFWQSGQTPPRGYTIPQIDLAQGAARKVIVDRDPGQYLRHPTTALLEDNKTTLTVYPKGHSKGASLSKRSTDGGKAWSERFEMINIRQGWRDNRSAFRMRRNLSST